MLKKDAVMVSLQSLSGSTGFVHIEDIAMNVDKVHQGFRWTRHKKQIRIDSVIRELHRCKKEGMTKANGDNWILTPKGIAYLKENDFSQSKETQEAPIRQILKSKLFNKWKFDKIDFEKDQFSFFSMLGVTPDSSSSVIQNELDILKSIATSTGNKELRKFVGACEKSWSNFNKEELCGGSI
jgi:hypothetical protein